MKNLIGLMFFLLIGELAECQNLISNPSFEEINEITTRWSGTFSAFNRRIKYWDSPTQGSPDILFINYLDKMTPKRPKVDLSHHTPRTGKFMIGLKTYGCETNTLHCKEYVQIKLKEQLTRGEKYFFEYWVCPISTSVKVNSFGLALSTERMKDINQTGLIDISPISMEKKLIEGDSAKWYRISGTFESDDNYEYLIIGNFGPDESIEFKKEKNGLEYGYYLLDDVLLKALHQKPFQEIFQEIKVNENIVLENILFEFDKATIIETSKPELDKLAKFLISNHQYSIDIMGHTDTKGSTEHNLKLSQKRANSIKQYLTEKGVNNDRIYAIGLGSKHPIVPNTSEKNRKINRRVEIKIKEK